MNGITEPLIGGYFSSSLGVWVAAFFTLAIYTFLYKDNVVYKFVENIFIGVAAGYLVIIMWVNNIQPELVEPLFGQGKLRLVLPLIMMLLIFTRVFPKIAWMSRIPISFVVGIGAGMAIPNTMMAMVVAQLGGMANIEFANPETAVLTQAGLRMLIGGIIMLLGTVAAIVYFFFSLPHEGPVGYVARFGTWILMIGFGASFGYTVMARISLLIGRVLFLLRDWLMIID
ncbi:MAG: hypothetical protein P9L99_10315 [Candidatus Lernaella stagnicola]|nr:hypothetical protein [Candidatus Lernaella stagnicola]